MNPANFQEDYHYKFKISILGDTKAGKSTFIESKDSNHFSYQVQNFH